MAKRQYIRKPIAELFWPKVDKRGPSECWPWKAAIMWCGYGTLGKKRSHRISWELHNGPIPDGLWVLHACDNRRCVNPAHLFLGRAADNSKDMTTKGRAANGERNGSRLHPERLERGEGRYNAKLTDDAVRDIRQHHGAQRPLARKYGVSRATIARVQNGLTWRHVTMPPFPERQS